MLQPRPQRRRLLGNLQRRPRLAKLRHGRLRRLLQPVLGRCRHGLLRHDLQREGLLALCEEGQARGSRGRRPRASPQQAREVRSSSAVLPSSPEKGAYPETTWIGAPGDLHWKRSTLSQRRAIFWIMSRVEDRRRLNEERMKIAYLVHTTHVHQHTQFDCIYLTCFIECCHLGLVMLPPVHCPKDRKWHDLGHIFIQAQRQASLFRRLTVILHLLSILPFNDTHADLRFQCTLSKQSIPEV